MTATPKSFVKVLTHKYFMSLVKEARRVKYIVKKHGNFLYKVSDDKTGDVVFSGMRHSGTHWVTSFSTLYWQHPDL